MEAEHLILNAKEKCDLASVAIPIAPSKGKTCLYLTAHISQGKQFWFEPKDYQDSTWTNRAKESKLENKKNMIIEHYPHQKSTCATAIQPLLALARKVTNCCSPHRAWQSFLLLGSFISPGKGTSIFGKPRSLAGFGAQNMLRIRLVPFGSLTGSLLLPCLWHRDFKEAQHAVGARE